MKILNLPFFSLLILFYAQCSTFASSFLVDTLLKDPVASLDIADKARSTETIDWTDGIQFTTCSFAAFDDTHPHIFINYLQDVSWTRYTLRAGLKKYQFPKSFQADVDKFAQIWINEAARWVSQGRELPGTNHLGPEKIAGQELAEKLALWWDENRDEENPVSYNDEFCGGDSSPYVTVVSKPPGGTIAIISPFAFSLCEAEGRSGYEESCGWKTVAHKGAVPMATYRYRVRRTDGTESCGTSDFEADWDGSDNEPEIEMPDPGGKCK